MVNYARIGFVNVIQGNRSGSYIVFCGDGFYYHKHHDRPHRRLIHLRCHLWKKSRVKCPGRAVVSRDGLLYQITAPHSVHRPDPFFVEERILRHNIISRAASGDPTPFFQMVQQEGQRGMFSAEARSRLPTSHLRTSLRNARISTLPGIPRNLATLGYLLSCPQFRHLTSTVDQSDSLFAGYCGNFGEGTTSVVFMSRRMMNVLQRMKKTITVARVLMQTRTQAAYRVLFAFLKHLMPLFDPDIIMCDHERGQVNAWMIEFPNALVETCLWHYAVDVFTHAKTLGMHDLMQNYPIVDYIVRMCCVIPLLPTYLLMQGLVCVGRWARDTGFMRLPVMRTFFRYIYREWMGRREYLSVCGSEDRTNNVSECSNSLLGWEVRQNRPNVYELIGCFVRQEDQFYVDIHALRDGRDASRAREISSVANDIRIQNLTSCLMNQRIDVFSFLWSAARCTEAAYAHVFN